MPNIIQVKQSLQKLISAGIKTPALILGSPGIAKSSIIKELAQENNFKLIDVRLGRLLPRDLAGLPQIVDNRSSYAPPSFLPDGSQPSILFLDEFNMSPPAMMGLAQELLLDRRIGEYRLPDNCFVFAAGNRKSDMCAVNAIPAAVDNRFIHFSVDPCLQTWLTNFAIPHGVDERIVAFLKFRPTLFHKYDKSASAWPSARSWDVASKLLKAGVDIDHSVGEGAGSEFAAYVRIFDSLPDIEAILAGAAKFKAPTAPDVMFAVIASLSTKFTTTKEFVNCFKWLATSSSPEYVSAFWSDSFEKARAIKGTILYLSKAIKAGSKEYDSELGKFMEKYNYLMSL